MSLQVQELIDKIKNEGVSQAEQQAKTIEQEARRKAETIVQEAQAQARHLVDHAKQESKKNHDSTCMALKQASRDMLLKLRREIENQLNQLIRADANKALSADNLTEMIVTIANGYFKQAQGDSVTLTLNERDVRKLKDGYLAKLKDKIKKSVTLQASEDIGAGFTISFDQGKSCFDFSDASLVEYLSSFLNTEVSSLLKESVSSA